jgi:hypothetical protein
MTGVQILARTWELSLHCSTQIDSGAHPTSFSMGTGGFIPGVKLQGHEADQSPPTSADVKKSGAVPSHSICLHFLKFKFILAVLCVNLQLQESLNKKSSLWNVSDLRDEALPESQREQQWIFATVSIQSLNYHCCTILTELWEGFILFQKWEIIIYWWMMEMLKNKTKKEFNDP